MARLKKTVTVRHEPERNRWRVDYYDKEGARHRPVFHTESEALAHKKQVESDLALELELNRKGMVIVDQKKHSQAPGKIVETEIKDAIKKYRELTKATLSPAAYQNDQYTFEQFYGWCVEDRVEIDKKTRKPKRGSEPIIYVDEITPLALSEYQSFLLTNKNSASTVNRKFNTLKSFFANCKLWGFTLMDLNEGIKARPEQKKPGRKVWTIEQLRSVLLDLGVEAAEMFLFLADVGCRPSQGFTLTWGQVDWDKQSIAVQSVKGGVRRDYTLPLSANCTELLRQRFYLAQKDRITKKTDVVFRNTRGLPWNRSSFGKHIRNVTRGLGFEGLVPYGLRHTFITELLRASVSHRKVQLLAGHAKFETTTMYAQTMQGDELHGEVNDLSNTRKLT